MADHQKRITLRDVTERASRVTEMATFLVNLVLVRHPGYRNMAEIFDAYVATENRPDRTQQNHPGDDQVANENRHDDGFR